MRYSENLGYANKFTIQLLAAVAEQYLDTLRKNTKAALAIAKKNGVQLGNPKNLKQASIKGNKVKQQQADQFAIKINDSDAINPSARHVERLFSRSA